MQTLEFQAYILDKPDTRETNRIECKGRRRHIEKDTTMECDELKKKTTKKEEKKNANNAAGELRNSSVRRNVGEKLERRKYSMR